MTNEQIIASIKDISSKYQTLCDELLESLRTALMDNQELRQRIKELENG